MSDETKYESNVYVRELGKDLTNLMEFLRQQDKDNKPILYAGKHIKNKVILPYKEYSKMQQALKLFDEIVEYFMNQGNIECLFRNALLGNTYQKYCENCIDEIKLNNPIDKETYDNLSKYFKKKEELKNSNK